MKLQDLAEIRHNFDMSNIFWKSVAQIIIINAKIKQESAEP